MVEDEVKCKAEAEWMEPELDVGLPAKQRG